MKLLTRYLLITITLAAPLTAYADTSMLRVMCEGEDVGAEVTVNDKFRGECPVDMQVAPGKLKLRVFKKMDDLHEGIYEQEIRMGEGIVKKVEVVLEKHLNAEGNRQEAERQRVEAERQIVEAAAQKREDDARIIRERNERYDKDFAEYNNKISQIAADEATIVNTYNKKIAWCDNHYSNPLDSMVGGLIGQKSSCKKNALSNYQAQLDELRSKPAPTPPIKSE